MWEINSFKATAETVPKLVDKLMEHVRNVLKVLEEYDPIYVYSIPIQHGLVFTGIHLHVQDQDRIPGHHVSVVDGVKKASEIGFMVTSALARTRGLSARQVLSHHIWGHYRESVCDWKRSSRYRPCLWNRTHNTYELRIIDFDQILPKNRRKLTWLLKEVFAVIRGESRPIDKNLIAALTTCSSDLFPAGHVIEDDGELRDAPATLRTLIPSLVSAGAKLLFKHRLSANSVTYQHSRCMSDEDSIHYVDVTYSSGCSYHVGTESDNHAPRVSTLQGIRDRSREQERREQERREQERREQPDSMVERLMRQLSIVVSPIGTDDGVHFYNRLSPGERAVLGVVKTGSERNGSAARATVSGATIFNPQVAKAMVNLASRYVSRVTGTPIDVIMLTNDARVLNQIVVAMDALQPYDILKEIVRSMIMEHGTGTVSDDDTGA